MIDKFSMVPRAGIEPAQYHYYQILSLARLPVSPPRLNVMSCAFYYGIINKTSRNFCIVDWAMLVIVENKKMARPRGFEPLASASGGLRSIQLS